MSQKIMHQIPNSQQGSVKSYPTQLQKNILPIVELKEKILLKVPKNVVKQIQYLCYNIPDNEWSGPIMYKVIGNFATGNFHCVVKDLYPMAKGSSAYTEYEFGEDFIKYRMAHPESLEWEVGNCHSHNNMGKLFA